MAAPIYYILAALLALITDNAKVIQAFSLVTAIATLFVARELVASETFVTTRAGKSFTVMIVCFLPQFVMYSLQLSNDSLTILLGFLALYQTDRLLKHSTTTNFLELVLVLSLGLLTKGQFLAISGIILPFACVCYWRRKRH